jgi:hypothetical protein
VTRVSTVSFFLQKKEFSQEGSQGMLDRFKRKKQLIDPSVLARRYTRQEVVQLMALLSGVVIDGDMIQGWDFVEDTPELMTVRIDFGEEYLDFQFYKSQAT